MTELVIYYNIRDSDDVIITAPIIGISRHRFLTDGEGVTTLVAFHGCPLYCKYCINPQCNTTEGVKERLSPLQLYDKVKIDDIYFLVTGGGIMFGGGEPLLQCGFISDFRKICGDKWKIYVETSLNVNKSHVESLINIVDYWVIDIKDWNDNIYFNYTGCHNKQVKDNLELILSKIDANKIMVRVPNIPGYNTDADITNTITELKRLGVTAIDKFDYIRDVKSVHKRVKHENGSRINDGKFKCEVLKSIRTHVAKCNQIPFEAHECKHMVCATGCCPLCDSELNWVTKEYYKIKNI